MADALSRAERSALHERMKFIRYQSGQTVYLPGDPSDTVYSVREGCIHLAYLASLIGATRETTSTALGRFERQGLIAKGHSRIVVKDAALLGQVK